MKEIVIIAGPNGAGKTTFAEQFIPSLPNVTAFVNADMIARGLSPFAPEMEAVLAGKLMLRQIQKLIGRSESFSLETTLAGRGYARKIPAWRERGYTVRLIFLSLLSPEMAISRVAARVMQGGHNVPNDVVTRRFVKGLRNFHDFYKNLVDSWILYDNSGNSQRLIDSGRRRT